MPDKKLSLLKYYQHTVLFLFFLAALLGLALRAGAFYLQEEPAAAGFRIEAASGAEIPPSH